MMMPSVASWPPRLAPACTGLAEWVLRQWPESHHILACVICTLFPLQYAPLSRVFLRFDGIFLVESIILYPLPWRHFFSLLRGVCPALETSSLELTACRAAQTLCCLGPRSRWTRGCFAFPALTFLSWLLSSRCCSTSFEPGVLAESPRAPAECHLCPQLRAWL